MGPVANHPLRGHELRRAVMVALLQAGRPLTIGEILVAVEHGGRTVDGGYPRKRLADALGYEARRGWVVRVSVHVRGGPGQPDLAVATAQPARLRRWSRMAGRVAASTAVQAMATEPSRTAASADAVTHAAANSG